jgi:SOS-response transcriptional repressor LexA
MNKDLVQLRRRNLIKLIQLKTAGNQSDFATMVEKSASAISDMIRGVKSFGEKAARAIEEKAQVESGWLDNDYENLTYALKDPKVIYGDKEDGGENNLEIGHVPIKGRIPLISWVSAGMFCEAIDNFQPGDAEEWVITTATASPNSYALRVRGDSMEPEFPAGSIIIVDPLREALPGNFVIAKNGGEATFKQLTQDGADRYLKPLNPRYPMKLIDEHMMICGVVVSMERRLV